MVLLTDSEIKGAIKKKEIIIEPFDNKYCLQSASYDMRIGKRAIIAKSVSLEELKRTVEKGDAKEIDLEEETSITIPAGGFALITTFEKVKFSTLYVGHIGIRSYYTRKGLALLSGLQIDPGFEGVLILGLCNLSPRGITLEYKDPICTIEIHRLNREATKSYSGKYTEEQKEGKIPAMDKDYLRTIETMSISDLTTSLQILSGNVEKLTKEVGRFWIPLVIAVATTLIAIIFAAVMTYLK